MASNAQTINTSNLNSILWKIESPATKNISYLLGSDHVVSLSIINKTGKILHLFNQSNCFVLELNQLQVQSTEKLNEIAPNDEKADARKLFGNDYDLVQNYFTNKKWGELESGFAGAPNQIASLSMVIGEIVSDYSDKLYKTKNNAADVGMDVRLNIMADSVKKEIFSLDNIAEDDKTSYGGVKLNELSKSIITLLKLISSDEIKVDPNDLVQQKLSAFMANYKKGKANFLLKQNMPEAEKIHKDLLKRNNLWLTKLPGLLRDKDCFITVGAAHLYYQEGLISRLKKMGYILTPVDLALN